MRTSESFPCLLGALLLAALLHGTSPAQATTVIKLGTLAPEGSSWITALRGIDAELRQATQDQVQLKIYPGGVQGDEDVMLRKMRIGQLQGAGLGGTAASFINPDVLAHQMPFLFDNNDEVDHVMAAMAAFYRDGFRAKGYELLGWTDVGFVYLLSRNPVDDVDDLQGAKVWRLKDEPITGAVFGHAGVTSVPLGIPDVLLGLQTNLVDVVYAPPSAAIVLQWFTRVRYYTDMPINYANGAIVVLSSAFDALTPAQQEHLRAISTRHIEAHNRRSRRDNAEALELMLREGVRPVAVSAEAVAHFRSLVDRSLPDLVGRAFSRQAHDLVRQHLDELRTGP